MRILELVFQGVPGSHALARLPVAPGITVLVPGAAGPLPLRRLLAYALYDESVEPPAELRAPGAEAARLGLTVQDAAGGVFRVVRDLKTGAVQLLRYEAATKKFLPVSTRAAEVGQYLRSQVRVPAEDLFKDLYALSADDLPSRRPADDAAPGVEAAGPPGAGRFPSAARGGGIHGPGMSAGAPAARPRAGFPGYQGDGGGSRFPGYQGGDSAMVPEDVGDTFAGLSLDEKRAKLAALKELQTSMQGIDELQFRLDGLQNKAFKLDDSLKQVQALESEVSRHEEALFEFGDLERLPEDFEAKAREYAFLADRLEKTLARMEAERDTLGERMALPPQPPVRHPVLLGGLGVAAAATALSVLMPDMRWLAAVDPVGLGAVGFVMLQWISDREQHEGMAGKVGTLEERSGKARRQFELETSVVRKVMKDLGVSSPQAVLERYAARTKVVALRDEAKARLASAQNQGDYKNLVDEREALRREIESIEQQLAGSGGYAQDPGDLKRDVEALEDSIARAERGETEAAPPAPEPAAPADDLTFGGLGGGSLDVGADPGGAAPSGPSASDPAPMLLARLSDILHCDAASAGERLGDRPGQYLAALTNKSYVGVRFVGKGETELVAAIGGRTMGWGSLSALDQDLVYLALRLAFAEAALRADPQPVVLTGPFDELDAPRKQMVGKMLRFLAGATQVIHASADPFWPQTADTVHKVG